MKSSKIQTIKGGFIVPRGDLIGGWQIAEQRLDHDRWLLPILQPFIKEGDTVVDIGAFNGDHTVAYSEWVGAAGRVFAIEPGKLAYACLNHNSKRFLHRNVVPIRCALGDWFSRGAHRGRLSQNLGSSEIIEGGGGEDVVQIVPLDLITLGVNVSFIKIDAEGWEHKILDGAKKTIAICRPVMCIEVRPHYLPLEEISSRLEKMKYKFRPLQGDTSPDQYDLLCEPL